MNGSWFSICKSYQVASFIKLLDCLKKKKTQVTRIFFFFLEIKLLDFVSLNQNFPNGTSSNQQIKILDSLESCRA